MQFAIYKSILRSREKTRKLPRDCGEEQRTRRERKGCQSAIWNVMSVTLVNLVHNSVSQWVRQSPQNKHLLCGCEEREVEGVTRAIHARREGREKKNKKNAPLRAVAPIRARLINAKK